MKLVIGIPTAGNPAAPFVASLQRLVLPDSVTAIENKTVTGNFVPAQRELLADFALERSADFLLMTDDDMVIPADAIGRLLEPFEDARVGIVGALCYSRDGLRPMTVAGWDPEDTTTAWIPAFDDRTPTQVDGVGFGLAIVRIQALAQLARPFFPVQVYVEKAAGRARICNEDFLFCKRLRDGGSLVVLHPGVRCGHYDRDSELTQPLQWEPPEKTNFARMFVREPNGAYATRPLDRGVDRSNELHLKASLEYILSD